MQYNKDTNEFTYDDADYDMPRRTYQVEEKVDTHIVIKRDDVKKYLSEVEQIALNSILLIIANGRRKDGKVTKNSYYVCNTDEPYAELVKSVIVGGEAVKNM